MRLGRGLEYGGNIIFEEHIGIDYAALVENELFWRYRNGRYREGLPLAGVGLGYIWKKKKKGKALPPFALNLFIQAKRSNQRSPVPKKAKDKGLATPCWFFNIDQQQQSALHRLSSALKGKGLVCYAAPAFLSQSDLYHHTEKRSIVQNSTFPSAGKLQGHSRWYYDRCGTFGVANPQFERVEVGQIDAQIEALSNQRDGIYESLSENLSFLAEAVNSTTDDPGDISSRDTWFSHLAQLLTDEAQEMLGDIPNEMRSYLRIRAYCHAYNLEWLSLQ